MTYGILIVNKVVQSFTGHKQNKYVLKAALGGRFDNYVLCGSEDDKIYIWNRNNGDLIDKLEGHTDTVNGISWSPIIPNFFVSCSDDQTIKVWGISEGYSAELHLDGKYKSKDEDMSDQDNDEEQFGFDDSNSMSDSDLSDNSNSSMNE